MIFLILLIICFTLGLILSKIENKTNQISTEIYELDKEVKASYRGLEYRFMIFETELSKLKEMVGADK